MKDLKTIKEYVSKLPDDFELIVSTPSSKTYHSISKFKVDVSTKQVILELN